ncbi:hypothetical protein BVH75_12335 [Bacillus thuringiensis]|nr:hypothetical protein BVH75_12335 [Bacillus thuringiensis]
MKIHSVFNYKLHGLKVKCVTKYSYVLVKKLYQRLLEYISDFQNISAHLQLYQRFSGYIDLPTTKEKAVPKIVFGQPNFLLKT